MQGLGGGTAQSDFCFWRVILDALLRKDSRRPSVEVRRSDRGDFNHPNADDDGLDEDGESGGGNSG